MKLALSLLFSACAFAQTLTLTGPASAQPGQTITLSLNLAGGAAANLTAIQWTDTSPATASASATAAGKGVYCNGGLCVLAGLIGTTVSNNPFTDGVVGTIQFTVPASTPFGSLAVPLTGLVAANTSGAGVTLTAGATYTVAIVPSSCDVNSDGKTDGVDVGLMINGLLGKGACPISKPCSLVNAVAVLLAASGGACVPFQ